MLREELVGRQAELADVEAFADPSATAKGPVLVIEGEAGIGKTALWRTAVGGARERRVLVLSSAPAETETHLPYVVLRDLLDFRTASAIADLPRPLSDALQVAVLRAPVHGTPIDQLAVASACLNLIRHLSATRPVLVAVDDVQFADRTSLAILGYFIRRLDTEPVKVLCAMRTPQKLRFLQQAFGTRQIATLRLGPLPANAIDELLERHVARPLSTPELRRVHAMSGGNPYFALEIARQLLEEPSAVTASVPNPLPNTIAELLENRIRRLPRKTRDLLVGMAALSRPDLTLLKEIDPVGGIRWLEATLDAQVIERVEGGIRFAHPLLASVIYAMAAPAERRVWHARLATLVSDPEERARHLALATIGPDPEVAHQVEAAARSAHLRGARAEAAALARQAVDLTPGDLVDAAVSRRIFLAECMLRAGDANSARALLEAVLSETHPNNRPAEALRLLAAVEFGAGNLPEVVRLLEEALQRSGDDLQCRGIVERDLMHAHSQQGHFVEALEHSERLAEVAARAGDPRLRATALRIKAASEQHLGRLTAESRSLAIAVVEGTADIALEDTVGGLHPMLDWAVVLKWSDDFGRARVGLRRALELTEGRDESLRAPILFHLAELECWAGDWASAETYVRACEQSVRHSGQKSFARLHLTARALLHCYRGELSEAEQAAGKALKVAMEVGDHPFRQRALIVLGLKELSSGEPRAAWGHLQRLGEGRGQAGFRGALRSTGDEVEALVGLGRLDEARLRCAELAGRPEPWPRAIGARSRGLIAAATGDFEAASAEFEVALREHRELAMPLEEARTILAYGGVLRRARKGRAAGATLQEALAKFEALGARAWSARASYQLGLISGRHTTSGRQLSLREDEVAALVAKGLGNQEIAQRLFISRRTAESHVDHILAKLGLHNRSELVAWYLKVAKRSAP